MYLHANINLHLGCFDTEHLSLSLKQLPHQMYVLVDHIYSLLSTKWRHAVAQLVEALRYKPEGRRFDREVCLETRKGKVVSCGK